MTARGSRSSRTLLRALITTVVLLSACVEPAPTDPVAELDVRFAKGGSGGGGGGAGGSSPTVKETNPSSGARSTTLTVRVIGSNYVAGSRAVWALNGDSTFAITKVKTNFTTYVSSRELLANITIEGDASIDLYDVIVITPTGKKGIGIELFAVTPQIALLPVSSGYTIAAGINNSGTVVGYEFDTFGTPRGIRWSRSGTEWTLSPIAEAENARAYSINAAGTIVGTRAGRAVVWPGTGGSFDLGAGQATDVNADETVIGTNAGNAVVWTRVAPNSWSSPQVLPTLGGVSASGETTRAVAINDANRIVGLAFNPAGAPVVVSWALIAGVWTGPSELRPGSNIQFASDVNASGEAVGTICSSLCPTAAIFAGDGTTQSLPNLGAASRAYAVNSSGQTVGWARVPGKGNFVGAPQPVAWIGGFLLKLPLPAGSSEGEARAVNDNGDAVGEVYGIGTTGRPAVWTMQ